MNKRLLVITVLVMLVIGGMIAGLFMGSIQKALTLPTMHAQERGNTKQGQTAVRPGGQGQRQPPSAQNPNPNMNPTVNANPTTQGQNNQANVLAQDSFQRADQPLWGVASDGRQWEGDANTSQAFSVTSAAGRISNGQGTLNAVLGTPTTDAEVLASASVNQFNGTVNFGVVLRWGDDANWYKALLDGTHLNLLKRVNGQSVTLKSVRFTTQADRVYMLRFRSVGAVLFARAWRIDQTEPNRWLAVISDSDLKTGRAGVRVVVQPATVINVTSFTAQSATLNNDGGL